MQVYLFRRNNINYYVKIVREDGTRVLVRSLAGSWLLEAWVSREELLGSYELEERELGSVVGNDLEQKN